MKAVVCIDSTYFRNQFTTHKTYETSIWNKYAYKITDDNGEDFVIDPNNDSPTFKFITLDEWRELKLSEIGI